MWCMNHKKMPIEYCHSFIIGSLTVYINPVMGNMIDDIVQVNNVFLRTLEEINSYQTTASLIR